MTIVRLAASVLLPLALAGCTTLINPYLDPSPLNDAAFCKSGETTEPSCDVRKRFIASQKAVAQIQARAHAGYSERATVNSLSSAAALPLAAVMLYQGVEHGGNDAVRQRLLKGGLGIAAAYEVRNTLIANSPEAVYTVSEARLSCVATEALAYRTEAPDIDAAACAKTATELENEALDFETNLENTSRAADRDALVGKTRKTLQQFYEGDQRLTEGMQAMHSAARKIVADTNAALKTSTLSFAQATTLLRSQAEPFAPATVKKGTGAQNKAEEEAKWIKHAAKLNAFARQCVRPQPATTAPFDACTTYSPTAPPPTTVSTTLPGNELSLNAGEQRSFVITSSPSGTPWASWAGGEPAAGGAVEPLQIVTLSPTQSQVTIKYKTAVPARTTIALLLTTLGAVGTPTTVNVTLNPAAGAGGAGTADTAPAAATGAGDGVVVNGQKVSSGAIAKFRSAKDLHGALKITDKSTDAQIAKAAVDEWRRLCPGQGQPTEKQLQDATFDSAIKDGKTTPASTFCKP